MNEALQTSQLMLANVAVLVALLVLLVTLRVLSSIRAYVAELAMFPLSSSAVPSNPPAPTDVTSASGASQESTYDDLVAHSGVGMGSPWRHWTDPRNYRGFATPEELRRPGDALVAPFLSPEDREHVDPRVDVPRAPRSTVPDEV